MKTYIYRASKKEGMYLYFKTQDDFDCLPQAIVDKIGRLNFAMELELSENKKLARADAKEVMASLESQGFYLQMPPSDEEQLAWWENDKLDNPDSGNKYL